MEDPLPRHYTPLVIGEYNGSVDLDDHLAKFDNAVILHQYIDGVKCRVFLITLSGPAQRWFTRLPIGSIRSFKDFWAAFLHHFTSSRRHQKTSVNLFSLKQGPRETLRTYIQRFNQVAMDIPAISPDVLVNGFTQGLVEGEFFWSLICRPLRDFAHLQKKATEYINVEEAQAARRKEAPAEPHAPSERRVPDNHQPPRGLRATGAQQYPEPRTHAVHVEANLQKKSKKWTLMFCKFHQSRMHNTWECRGDPNVHRPKLREYRHRSPTPEQHPERRTE
ncbi:uncharacterized protein LOC122055143 [Zingiber officinale]|uniref:uncharacterized protein LOC122055143 n=1 Tax=Zingiber officinale TaxID=94328 RepID=UPI001C4D49DB|nr:uncharacterized protein LOC122055143 [Zingiber officinale]